MIDAPNGKGLWHWLWAWSIRDIRLSGLGLVVGALIVIVASVFSLSAIVDRLDRYMDEQGRAMLAADIVLQSSRPLSTDLQSQISEFGLQSTEQVRFRTMAFHGDSMELVRVKAVGSDFPLLGKFVLRDTSGAVRNRIQPGDVWIDDRLQGLLNATSGDDLALGDAEMVISGVVETDPELSLNPFNQVPYVYVHKDSLSEIGATQIGSRVSYRQYFVGNERSIASMQSTVQLNASQRWHTSQMSGNDDSIVSRARDFLALTLALAIVMATATLYITGQHFTKNKVTEVTMMKSLGASRGWIWRWLLMQLLLIVLIGGLCGLVIGVLVEQWLVASVQSIFVRELPGLSFFPLIVTLIVSALIVLPCLGIPLARLQAVPAYHSVHPMQRLPWVPSAWLLMLPAWIGIGVWAKTNGMVGWSALGLTVAFLVVAIVNLLVIRGGSRLKMRATTLLAIRRLSAQPWRTGSQMAAMACALMMLALVWMAQSDLLKDWEAVLPADAPNMFALNIAPYERESFEQSLMQSGFEFSPLFPVVRGRLTHINGEIAQGDLPPEDRARALRRELNFTWQDAVPSHNTVVAGQWTDGYGVSIEEGLADRLDVRVGDELQFEINAQTINVPVTSVRYVPWRSMQPNFYFIFPPAVLDAFSAMWLTSFKVESNSQNALNDLSRAFPTVSLFDLRVLTERTQGLLNHLTVALKGLAAMSVVAGLLLVITMVRLTMEARAHEAKIYRILGADQSHIRQTLIAEFVVLGGVSGLVAALGAEIAMASLAHWVLDIPVQWHGWVWVVLPMSAMGVVLLTLMHFIRKIVREVA